MKSKTTALILCWLFGGFGIHHFYLGKTGAGVLSVLFFWTAIPLFVAVVNFFQILLMSDEQFDLKYNEGQCSNTKKMSSDPLTDLKKLNELKENGVITSQEFQEKKEALMKRVA